MNATVNRIKVTGWYLVRFCGELIAIRRRAGDLINAQLVSGPFAYRVDAKAEAWGARL